MVKDYLNALKSERNFSWSELSEMSGLPDATIRKIFSGETADPRFETIAKLVIAMGGSLDEILGTPKEAPKNDTNAMSVLHEVYEMRISEIKKSYAEHLESLKKDKRYLAIACAILGTFIIGWLLVDLMIGSVGWFRY